MGKRRQEFWVKDDGTAESVSHLKVISWAKEHPFKSVKIVDVGPKKVGVYSITSDGSTYDFDGAYLDKDLLVRILKCTGE